MKKSKKLKKKTKKNILQVALELFAEQGFHGTSMRELAMAVEIQKSSIYSHFNSKEEILKELFQVFGPATLEDKLKSKVKKERLDKPKEFLKFVAGESISMLENIRERRFFQILLREHTNETVRKKIKAEFFDKDKKIMMQIFTEMMEAGVIKQQDSHLLAEEFIGTLVLIKLKYLLLSFEKDNLDQFYKLAAAHVDFFWETVKK